MESSLFMIVLNLIVTSAGGYISLCRLARMSRSSTKLAIRWQYVIWFVALCASGWSFVLFDPADSIQLLLSMSIVAHLALGAPAWANDTPRYARREYVSGHD